ncbi:MAG: HAD family phosphatase [Oscillospiraceae bacterium]|nr:HAD family phosphatase [Oscillospiraceae bacterium]
MKITSILFDNDGLLVDSERVTFEIWQEIFLRHGYDLSMEDYCEVVGLNEASTAQHIMEKFPGLDPYEDVFREWDERYEILAPAGGVPLKKGAVELLDYADSRGFRKAVASSNSLYWVSVLLGANGIFDRMDAVSHGKLVTHGKPAPDIFLKAAELLGSEPSECLVLEDSPNGIRAAAAAGMVPICIPDLRQPPEEITELCAAVLSDLGAVIGWLEENTAD